MATSGAGRLGTSAAESATLVGRTRLAVNVAGDAPLLRCHSGASKSCPCKWLLTAPNAPISAGTPERYTMTWWLKGDRRAPGVRIPTRLRGSAAATMIVSVAFD